MDILIPTVKKWYWPKANAEAEKKKYSKWDERLGEKGRGRWIFNQRNGGNLKNKRDEEQIGDAQKSHRFID